MAVNNYTNRRNASAQMNTGAGTKNGRTAAQRDYAQYQYGAAATQPTSTRRRTASQASPARRQSASQAAPARRQSVPQEAPVRRQSASQANPARRQAPVRHQVNITAEKGKVTLQASPVNKLALLVMTLAFAFLGVMVLWYVSLQSDITQLRSSIQTLESDINDLTASNDEYLNRIEASVDLEKVREIAIMDLGMVYADEDQIITYDSQIDDYLEQSVVITDGD